MKHLIAAIIVLSCMYLVINYWQSGQQLLALSEGY
jgi:hypothetical protein